MGPTALAFSGEKHKKCNIHPVWEEVLDVAIRKMKVALLIIKGPGASSVTYIVGQKVTLLGN